jgi:catechol 2,3-dioxygenase-like lactoylglutathione lyase family enzyme
MTRGTIPVSARSEVGKIRHIMHPAHLPTRRTVLRSLAALASASRLMGQGSSEPSIRVRALNHMTLFVSDPKRSVEFYQGLFGMPIQVRQGNSALLRIGPGPQYIALATAGPNRNPGIDHFCMTVEGFDTDRELRILAEHGIARSDAAGALKAWTRMRGKTLEFYLGDPDGLVVQLQDPRYCGGGGALGDVCPATPEPSPRKGLIALRDLSHFTLNVSDAKRSRDFYQGLFGMRVQAYQGAMPVLAVGPGPQFLALGGGGTNRAPAIAHACMTMEGFEPVKVLKLLADFGIKPRGEARGPAGPMVSYVSMRMEDRGGAKGGTPELYFTDPDGIVMQLQDVSYCGGSGYLGEVCPS